MFLFSVTREKRNQNLIKSRKNLINSMQRTETVSNSPLNYFEASYRESRDVTEINCNLCVTDSSHVYTIQFLSSFQLFHTSDKRFTLNYCISLEAKRYELLLSYFTVQKYHLIKNTHTETQSFDTDL